MLSIACFGEIGSSPAPSNNNAPKVKNHSSDSVNESSSEAKTDLKLSGTGNDKMLIEKESFGKTRDGIETSVYICTNENGLVMKLTDFGATLLSLETPDKTGNSVNITLGFDHMEGYLQRHPYFGSTVGRYANRIEKSKFSIDGTEYTLTANEGENQLHGGKKAWDAVIWESTPLNEKDSVGVKFMYVSRDGEEGYPGTVQVTAIYMLTSDDELRIQYSAMTDKPTHINMANHAYWNLGGAGSGTIFDHHLELKADRYLEVDAHLIPTGQLVAVSDTSLDFTDGALIGSQIEALKTEKTAKNWGYDHCFVIKDHDGSIRLAARVKHPESGRVMEIYTTQPGVQFYSGNFLDGSNQNGGFGIHEALCLETQHYPDSPNKPEFPSTLLRPGEVFEQLTVHKFYVEP